MSRAGPVSRVAWFCRDDFQPDITRGEPFSFPEAALFLVSTKNRDLWPGPRPEVRDSRTSRHSAQAQSQV